MYETALRRPERGSASVVTDGRRGLAGVTVLRGMEGFGAHSRVHAAHILRLSEDLPCIVEIVDRGERLDQLMPFLDETLREGLVTREPVHVVFYRYDGTKNEE
ncbi:MAG: DUF190 domain-containing protein [Synergistales bacterium]|nr:DUF190 domain-containing protein [Synergistales bacterium]